MESISILGNNEFTDEQILRKVKIRLGEPFKRAKIEDSTLDILNLYANNGYVDAEVKTDLRINPEIHKVSVDFLINENLKYTIADIDAEKVRRCSFKFIQLRPKLRVVRQYLFSLMVRQTNQLDYRGRIER